MKGGCWMGGEDIPGFWFDFARWLVVVVYLFSADMSVCNHCVCVCFDGALNGLELEEDLGTKNH